MLSIKNITPTSRWIPILIVAFTIVFRLLYLGIKPPHFDEGVNGWFIDEMTRAGYYHYDPANYHGPLHFYILFIFERLLGRSVWAIRLPVAIISILTVYLVTQFDRFLDKRTCWIAALAMAVSPAMEFYGRYAIHESEFVFFLILAVWGTAGVLRYGTMPYLWAAALAFTGLILTKETYLIHFTAFLLALLCLWGLEYFLPSDASPPPMQRYSLMQVGTVALVCVGLIFFFYSGTFLDFSALKGLYLTFAEWAKTGNAGNGHQKTEFDIPLMTIHLALGKASPAQPIVFNFNYYWFYLIFRYEWPALIGLAATPLLIWPLKNRLTRFLIIYGWGTLAAYSIIHYKTPWCIITIIWPFFFVFGEFVNEFGKGFQEFIAKTDFPDLIKVIAGVLLALCLLSVPASLASSIRLNFKHYVDDKEPYVYVQTFEDIDKITRPLFKLVKEDPSNYALKGHIMLTSYHPLPWVLGDFTNLGWYDDARKPQSMDADFLLVDKPRLKEVETALKQKYFTESFRLRNSMDPSKLYLSFEKFHHLFPGRQPEFTPGKLSPEAEASDDSTDEQ